MALSTSDSYQIVAEGKAVQEAGITVADIDNAPVAESTGADQPDFSRFAAGVARIYLQAGGLPDQ